LCWLVQSKQAVRRAMGKKIPRVVFNIRRGYMGKQPPYSPTTGKDRPSGAWSKIEVEYDERPYTEGPDPFSYSGKDRERGISEARRAVVRATPSWMQHLVKRNLK
jgi:hypothetical protein